MRLTLLALLAAGPAHGYELLQALEKLLGPVCPPPNVGQVYVTLRRLEEAGLIVGTDVAQSGRPNKRIFTLTSAGREAVADWFEEPSEDAWRPDSFFVKLVLADRSGLGDPKKMIDQRYRQCRLRLRELSRARGTGASAGGPTAQGAGRHAEKPAEKRGEKQGEKGADSALSRLLVEGAMLHVRADLDWLDRCRQALR